jgi:predicted lipoprotein with Yx(FWY)xxD motif
MNTINLGDRVRTLAIAALAVVVLAACQAAGANPTPIPNAYGSSAPTTAAATPTAATSQAAVGVAEVDVATDASLGEFLVDSTGMTLYLYTKDTPGVSNCSGNCLAAWPALLTTGAPIAGAGVTGKLGTITRDDGSVQVTYNELPLYYYVSDTQAGDTTGQGVGGVWYIVKP